MTEVPTGTRSPGRPEDALQTVAADGLVPVAVVDNADQARRVADALRAAGATCLEVTLRTPNALDCVRAVRGCGLVVGAGTVVDPSQVGDALDAGARFLVSPGLDADVVRACQTRDTPVVPGVATASEVQLAARLGLTVVKFFPAGVLGGVTAVKALAGPFPEMRFIPTGGVTEADLSGYAACPSVFAVGGSWIVSRRLVTSGDFQEITRLTARALAIVARARDLRAADMDGAR